MYCLQLFKATIDRLDTAKALLASDLQASVTVLWKATPDSWQTEDPWFAQDQPLVSYVNRVFDLDFLLETYIADQSVQCFVSHTEIFIEGWSCPVKTQTTTMLQVDEVIRQGLQGMFGRTSFMVVVYGDKASPGTWQYDTCPLNSEALAVNPKFPGMPFLGYLDLATGFIA